MAKYSNQEREKEGIKGNGKKGKYRRGERKGVKKWENRTREGKTEKHEKVSTTGSNCGMITPCGLSRIHNLHDQMFYPLGYGVE
jgi:hypothetical protein